MAGRLPFTPSMTGRLAVALFTLVLAACGGSGNTASARREPDRALRAAESPRNAPSLAPAPGFGRLVGFHSARQLQEHFRKHGSEFGVSSARDYLAEAQRLRDAPAGGSILEAVRDDGVITRFDRDTAAFIAFDRDGTIRTFFKPNLGEQYFRRQARRRED